MKLFRILTIGSLLVAGAAFASPKYLTLDQKVVHEIRMYPRYTMWDNVNVRADGANVEITGQVSQPFKKADIQRIVAATPGVSYVINNLQVLPTSPLDDQLRFQVARAIFSDPVLSRYTAPVIPSIHVIVANGRVTLEGVVDSETAKNVAGIRANSGGLSFDAVTNNLRVESPSPRKAT